jgi:choline kinase
MESKKQYRLFILSAGKGTRLWPLTKNSPKSLVELSDGSCILERQIKSAIDSGIIDEITIITGYMHDKIEEFIMPYQKQIAINTIYNPFYDVSNNLLSLWTAVYPMKERDFIITNGDNIYLSDVFKQIIPVKEETIQVTIDYKKEYDFDDMKVSFDDDRITRIHKDIPLEKVGAESVGLCLVQGEKSRDIFTEKIIALAKDESYLNRFWLEIFNSLIDVNGYNIDYKVIQEDEWQEIDFHPDIEIVRKIFSTKI